MTIDKIQKYVFWTIKLVAEHIKMYLNFRGTTFFISMHICVNIHTVHVYFETSEKHCVRSKIFYKIFFQRLSNARKIYVHV